MIILLLLLLCLASPLASQERVLLDSATTALQAQRHEDARRLIDKAIAGGADNARVWELMGFAAQGIKDYNLMIDAGAKLAAIEPNNVQGWYFLTIGNHFLDRIDSMIPYARRFCELDSSLCAATGIGDIMTGLSQDPIGRLDSLFKTDNGAFHIQLPKGWFARVEDDGKLYHWFVSRQPITKAEDIFTEGVSIRWIRRLSKLFPAIGNNTDARFLTSFWDTYIGGVQGRNKVYYRKTVDSTAMTIAGWTGLKRIVDMQAKERSYRLRMLEVIVAREDEVVTVIMECPLFLWPGYKARFEEALRSLRLPD